MNTEKQKTSNVIKTLSTNAKQQAWENFVTKVAAEKNFTKYTVFTPTGDQKVLGRYIRTMQTFGSTNEVIRPGTVQLAHQTPQY